MTEQRLMKRVEAKKIALCAAETELAYYQAKAHMNAACGCIATEKRGPGRPVSIGTGHKLTVYLPIKTLEILNRLTSEWSGSKSEIIQEALARYAADLDGVIKEGEANEP